MSASIVCSSTLSPPPPTIAAPASAPTLCPSSHIGGERLDKGAGHILLNPSRHLLLLLQWHPLFLCHPKCQHLHMKVQTFCALQRFLKSQKDQQLHDLAHFCCDAADDGQ